MNFLPDTVYDVVSRIVMEVLTQPSTGLLSFAVLSALWTFSKSMNYLQKAFNKAYGVAKNRGLIYHQLMSLLVSFWVATSFCLCFVFKCIWSYPVKISQNYWQSDYPIFTYIQDFTDPLVYTLIFAILVMIYYFLPNVKVTRIRYVLPGSIFVLITLIFILNIFSSSINNYINNLVDVRFVSSIIFCCHHVLVYFIS